MSGVAAVAVVAVAPRWQMYQGFHTREGKKENKERKRGVRLTTPSSASDWCEDDPRNGGENGGVCVCLWRLWGARSGAQTTGINT